MTDPVVIGNATLYHGDCLEILPTLPAQSVDMVLCDLPYGMTACKWDCQINLARLWPEYRRTCRGAVVLFSAQPFTTTLIASNVANFRYEWIWAKNLPTGFANAKRQPMRAHENICVFYASQPTYIPQPTASKIKDRAMGGSNGARAKGKAGRVYGSLANDTNEITLKENVSPRTVLDIACVPRATGTLHPTQKPTALCEYLIRTYTTEGQTVLDNTMGSGTTGAACVAAGRAFIGIEIERKYFAIACKRIENAQRQARMFA